MEKIPVIDLSRTASGEAGKARLAGQMHDACVHHGFFYVAGHGVPIRLQQQLEEESRWFFGLSAQEKQKLRMSLAGRAWRGYFSVGEEFTSGQPDWKEGLYFGAELPGDDERVKARLPMHGQNLFPEGRPAFRAAILAYMAEMEALGHRLMELLAISLELKPDHFRQQLTADPLLLFRIFHYPALPPDAKDAWGVGEHTDYGLLTILKQDDTGGLQVCSAGTWIDAPPIPNTFICNIGDMLDLLTGGYYRSTPHRVRNVSGKGRFSYPFFFDPGFTARITPIRPPGEAPGSVNRWDAQDIHQFKGTYGEYLLRKVSQVFPELSGEL